MLELNTEREQPVLPIFAWWIQKTVTSKKYLVIMDANNLPFKDGGYVISQSLMFTKKGIFHHAN